MTSLLSSPDPVVLTAEDAELVVDTERYACSVECCPADAHLDAVIIGTYQLDEVSKTRDGDVQLYRVGGGEDGVRSGGEGCDGAAVKSEHLLEKCATLEMPTGGVLDSKWDPSGGTATLACATATGSLVLVQLRDGWRDSRGGGADTDPGDSSGDAAPLQIVQASEPTGYLFLSVDWNNRPTHGGGGASPGEASSGGCDTLLAVSEAEGCLSVWRTSREGDPSLTLEHRWDAHTLCGLPSETWTVAFNPWQPQQLFSGADDAILKGWDLRCAESSGRGISSSSIAPSPSSSGEAEAEAGRCSPAGVVEGADLCAVRADCHDAGVTALCFSPWDDHVLVSGSYDGVVRFWDLRKLGSGRRGQPVATVDVGGGVWRLKWHPSRDALAVASMHNGVHVVSVRGGAAVESADAPPSGAMLPPMSTAAFLRYDGHGSMAYGVDWCRSQCPDFRADEAASALEWGSVVSCSFYDHAAHYWRVPALNY
jgi:diphthamide biosynthesis protein 7